MPITEGRKMTLDSWDGTHCTDVQILHPDQDSLERAIRNLDQHKHTLVGISVRQGEQMLVGGGNGDYIVTLEARDGTFSTLCSDVDDDIEIVLLIGGQSDTYPAAIVCSRDKAEKAASRYLSFGDLDPSMTWTTG